MTSLFETVVTPASEFPVDLLRCDQRLVSPLEFLPFAQVRQAVVEQEANAEEDRKSEAAFAIDERAAQMAVMIDAAREQAAAETKLLFAAQMETQAAAEQARAAALARAFAEDRQKYFHQAEAQIVQLALAVARRVLSREVDADAMALQGTIHAALARVQDESRSTLRVSEAEAAQWQAVFRGEQRVEVVADKRLQPGDCVLETTIGKVELGLEAQLLEVQRSFADLLFTQGEA